VYEDLDEAIKRVGTPEDYDRQCNQQYNRDYVGHNDHYLKGFVQNLNVWELLEHLCECINENVYKVKENIKENGLCECDNADEIEEQYRMLELETSIDPKMINKEYIRRKPKYMYRY
jgi:hypothetical protein